ncbi:MAG TPA: hypothetical protein VHN74_14100 [Candidatus Angelobacter sp.]|jgi:hypothetical protein|nr:hypothetical protein [Candidatus Angelobacter sp.]
MTKFLAILVSFFSVLAALAQSAPGIPAIPTITFDRLWEASTPQEYTFTVKSGGTATYVSRNPTRAPEDGSEKDPDYQLEFTLSPNTRDKIFKLAQEANYFDGNFDFTKHAVASTGRKTLSYADQSRHFQTVFNHSENKPVQELAQLFLAISNTIESGRKLQFKHKYDKLGLESELQGMETAAEGGNLAEIQLIAPTLQKIADDSSVLNIARKRAKHLLGMKK